MNIAVSLTNGKFVSARVISRLEIEDGISVCAIRSVSANAPFSAIHEQTGATICKGARARDVISKARDLIAHRREAFLASVANLPPAPAADHPSVLSSPSPAKKVNVENVANAIITATENWSTGSGKPLTDDEKGGILRALSTATGRLKASPPRDPWGRAAWLGIQPNPFKVGVGACLLLPEGPRALLERLSAIPFPASLDKDRDALERMGAW